MSEPMYPQAPPRNLPKFYVYSFRTGPMPRSSKRRDLGGRQRRIERKRVQRAARGSG